MKLYATCDHGLEAALAEELAELGAPRPRPGHRGVYFRGGDQGLWRSCLGSRLANRILWPLAEFAAPDERALYDGLRRIAWHDYFTVHRTIALDASSHRSQLNHTGYLARLGKDAICDHFRDLLDKRPSVDRDAPEVVINLRLYEGRCTVSLDAGGARLHRRGYRGPTGAAPLKETLAAGILRLTGWDAQTPLIDPMCGAGTFLIEAALMATRTAPGLLRLGEAGFAFERWRGHDKAGFAAVVAELRAAVGHAAPPLVGYDADRRVIAAARQNAQRAGVAPLIQFEVRPLSQAAPPIEAPGLLVSNPPYGQRLDADAWLYAEMGDALKQRFAGWTAWLFVAREAPVRHIGLRPARKIPLRNGPIDCRVCRYDLYKGSAQPERDHEGGS